MVRSPCCDNVSSMKKGPWTAEEDEKLLAYIQEHGHGSWRSLPSKAGLQRCGKSCRLRWTNYLRPDIKRGKFSLQEEQTIIQLHALLGNRWSTIATQLPERTDNEIKNYWNTHLKKRLTKMGIDPITHKPQNLALNIDQSKEIANISHMAQWESARLQAEARLVRESKLIHRHLHGAPATPLPPPALPLAQMSRAPCLDILKVWEWTYPGKDISSMILNGSSHSKVDNILPASTMALCNGNSSFVVGVDSLETPDCNSYHKHNEMRGIVENSAVLDRPMHQPIYVDQEYSIGFSNFIEGLEISSEVVSGAGTSNNALVGCWGVPEENIKANCWSNSMGSPMF